MRMKKFFSLLLAVSMIAVSCTKSTTPVPTPTPEPEPTPENPVVEYLIDMAMDAAVRVPSEMLELSANHFVIGFNDDNIDYQFAVILKGNEGDEVLQAGTYNTANGGLVFAEEQELFALEEAYILVDGEVVVEGDVEGYKFDIKLVDTLGNNFHFTYEGVVELMTDNTDVPEQDVEFEATHFDGFYYGGNNAGVHNMIIALSNLGLDEESNVLPSGIYYTLDMYCSEPVIDEEGYVTVPAGTYTLSYGPDFVAGDVDGEYSDYVVINESMISFDTRVLFDDLTLTVTEDSLLLEAVLGGCTHTVTYAGAPKFRADMF